MELSDHARYLDSLRELPDVRHDRIESIRAQIADGSYETDGKIDAVIDRLLEDIDE